MKTATNKTKKNVKKTDKTTEQKGVQKYSNTSTDLTFDKDFDAIYNMDEKEVNKQLLYKQNKEGKKLQLMAKYNDTKMKLVRTESKLNASFVDPTADSVDLCITMKCLNEEMDITKNLCIKLFPETVSMFS